MFINYLQIVLCGLPKNFFFFPFGILLRCRKVNQLGPWSEKSRTFGLWSIDSQTLLRGSTESALSRTKM